MTCQSQLSAWHLNQRDTAYSICLLKLLGLLSSLVEPAPALAPQLAREWFQGFVWNLLWELAPDHAPEPPPELAPEPKPEPTAGPPICSKAFTMAEDPQHGECF